MDSTQQRIARRERAQQAAIEAEQQNAAREAMIEEYGPQAGDPAAFGQMQRIKQNNRRLDITEQRFQTEQEEAERLRRQEAAQRVSALVAQRVNNGAGLEAAFDSVTPILERGFGMDRTQIEELRGAALANPEAAPQILASLGGVQPQQAAPVGKPVEALVNGQPRMVQFYDDGSHDVLDMAPYERPRAPTARYEVVSPAEMQELGFAPGTVGQRNLRTGEVDVAQEADADAQSPADPQVQRQMRDTYESTRQRFAVTDSAIAQTIDQTGPFSAGMFSASGVIPGTPAANLIASISSNQAAAAFGELEKMKQAAQAAGSRGSGLGQVTEREIQLLQNRIAALDTAQSPAQLREALRTLRRDFRQSFARVDRAYREFLESAPDSSGQGAGQGGGQGGVEYIYRDGQLVEAGGD
jgi:hypothetical protein